MNYSAFLNFFYSLRQRTGEFASILWSFLFVRIYLLLIVISISVNWAGAYLIYRTNTAETLVLHYNIDFGANLIDRSANIYIIPALGLVIFLFNLSIAATILRYRADRFMGHLLLSSALLVNYILSAALAILYTVNFG